MANDDHIALLKKGVDAWNTWRGENPDVRPDLSGASLPEIKLPKVNLSGARLDGINFYWAYLREAQLSRATISKADLRIIDLSRANLQGADLRSARLDGAYLRDANLSRADLRQASLLGVNFNRANLNRSKLEGANLRNAILVGADLTQAVLNGSRVYGASIWDVKTSGVKQRNLVITRENESSITVDNLKLAQFIHLMLNNAEIREVIDTVTSKAVLILGRFTAERKAVLDALRKELRKRDRLPILFDFEAPARQNLTETITLLARMARFIIADLTDPSSIPQELQAIIPSVRVPIQPLLLEGSSRYSIFKDFNPRDYHWVLPVYRYKGPKQLLATLKEKVIAPAEGKAKALEQRRRMIEAG
jgi:uncharacterized protein YjbI with pentapeptide repeats